MEKIQLLKKKDFGAVFNDSIQFATQNMKRYATAFLYIMMPPVLLMLVATAFTFNSFTGIMKVAKGFRHFEPAVFLPFMGSVLLLMILGMVTMTFQGLLAYGYMLKYEEASDPNEIKTADIWDFIKVNIGYMIVSYLGLMLISILFMVVNVIVLVIVFKMSGILGGFVLFGLMFVWTYLALPIQNFIFIRLRERLGIIDSIKRCYALTRGYWWRTFGVAFIIGIVVSMVSWVCIMPLYVVNMVTMMHHLAADPTDTTAMFTPLYAIMQGVFVAVSTFFSAITSFANCINYYSLVENSDNTSLLHEIGQIGDQPDPQYRQDGSY